MRNTGSILNWKQKYSSILPRQKYFYYMYFSIAHLCLERVSSIVDSLPPFLQ